MKINKNNILYLLLILSLFFFHKNKDPFNFGFLFEDGEIYKKIQNNYSSDLIIVNVPIIKQDNFYYYNNNFSKPYTILKQSKIKTVSFTSSFRMVYLVKIAQTIYELDYYLDTLGINHQTSLSKIINQNSVIKNGQIQTHFSSYKSKVITTCIVLISSILLLFYTHKRTKVNIFFVLILGVIYFVSLCNIIVDIRYLIALKNILSYI